MKKLISVILVTLGLTAIAFVPNLTIAAGESGTVTAAARGSFASKAAFRSVTLSAIDVGSGVFVEPDGSATGPFSAVLAGSSLLGQAQQITVDGNALQGAIAPNGRAYFSGVATIDLGNGTPPLAGVPFNVTTTTDSLLLSLDSTALPAMRVTAGTISVE
jgi:hypothetical protein